MEAHSDGHSRAVGGGHPVTFFTDADHRRVEDHLRNGRFFWLDIEAPTDEQVKALGRRFGLHSLTVEDALTFSQRPKVEEYDSYMFMVLYGADAWRRSLCPWSAPGVLPQQALVITAHAENTRSHQSPGTSDAIPGLTATDAPGVAVTTTSRPQPVARPGGSSHDRHQTKPPL